MSLVAEDTPHRGGGACWTPLSTREDSRSEAHRKAGGAEEMKEERKQGNVHGTCLRRRWRRTKGAETDLVIGEDFRRKTEANIESEEDSGQKKPEWHVVRRMRRTKAEEALVPDEDSLKDSDSSLSLIHCDSLWQGATRRKRQRTDMKEIDGREMQEHQMKDKKSTKKTD